MVTISGFDFTPLNYFPLSWFILVIDLQFIIFVQSNMGKGFYNNIMSNKSCFNCLTCGSETSNRINNKLDRAAGVLLSMGIYIKHDYIPLIRSDILMFYMRSD